jgi:ABC-type amino acid transport substrate-binding protein
MKQHIISYLALVLAAIALLISYTKPPAPSTDKPATEETTFQAMQRSGVLKCGYYLFPPMVMRDPNTKELSGLAVDLMNYIARQASIKVEWAEEVDFGTWVAGLQAKRFDAVCAPLWPDIAGSMEVLFTQPMFYASIKAYARSTDHRFDNNLQAINSPDVTVSVIDGNVTRDLAVAHFPKAKLLGVAANAGNGAAAQNVLTNKADIFLWDDNGVHEFMKSNPNSLRDVAPNQPVKVMPFALPVRSDDHRLRDFLNNALESMENDGTIRKLIDQWEVTPNSFYRLRPAYVINQ